jgi:hypothetical protein
VQINILHIQQISAQNTLLILLVCFIRWITKYVRADFFWQPTPDIKKFRKCILKIFIHSLSWAALLRQMFLDLHHDSLFPENLSASGQLLKINIIGTK